jgi:hypothetical protein
MKLWQRISEGRKIVDSWSPTSICSWTPTQVPVEQLPVLLPNLWKLVTSTNTKEDQYKHYQGHGQYQGNSGNCGKPHGYWQSKPPVVHHIKEQADSDADTKKQVIGKSITLSMPSNFNLNCIPPLNTNHINTHNDNLFLCAQIKDSNNKEHNLMVLPDTGNRAKCILRYDVYQKPFLNQPVTH